MANFVSAGRNNLQWPTSSWSGKGLKILDTVRELLIFLVVQLANIVRKIVVKTICIAIPWIKNHEHYTSVTGWPRLGEAQLSRSTSGPTALPLSQNSSNEWVLSGGISPHIVYILITPPYRRVDIWTLDDCLNTSATFTIEWSCFCRASGFCDIQLEAPPERYVFFPISIEISGLLLEIDQHFWPQRWPFFGDLFLGNLFVGDFFMTFFWRIDTNKGGKSLGLPNDICFWP